MGPSTDDLGPLPEGDRQDTLQQLSLKAVRNAVPEGLFLFRDERVDDKGIDGALEVKTEVRTTNAAGGDAVKSYFTNCRAQVQLKSTDKAGQNQDGSVSYPMETSNLNYLLNGPSPIYMLWVAATGEVRFAWARDEWKRLDSEIPAWQKQGTFTIRFRESLNQNTVQGIHNRILSESRLARRINESLTRSALSERVVVSIDPKSLTSSDPIEIHSWLSKSGMTIVSAGFGKKVAEWCDVINPEQRAEPRIRLIAAYASATLGRYQEALGHLSAASLRKTELTAPDARFLTHLRDACTYQTGRIDLTEYLKREEEWTKNQAISGPQHRLEALRHRRLSTTGQTERAKLLTEMKVMEQAFQTEPDATKAHKVQARIILLSAEGDDLSARFLDGNLQVQANFQMGFPVSDQVKSINAEFTREWDDWEKRSRKAILEAGEEGHPLLLAEAILMRATIHVGNMIMFRIQTVGTGEPWKADEARVSALLEETKISMDIFHKAGHLEGETRARLLLADMSELLGKVDEAKVYGEESLGVAEAMGYDLLAARAQSHVSGKTTFQSAQSAIEQRRGEDEDLHLANESDEAIRGIARYGLEVLRLPRERLPVLEREWFAFRTIARERLRYCRHIELLQNLTHQNHQSTHYRTDPPRLCVCLLHKFRLPESVAEVDSIIADFKRQHCNGCADRSPKN